MATLARAWLELDVALRAYLDRVGQDAPHTRALVAAIINFQRPAARLALTENTAKGGFATGATAKEDFAAIVRLARAAGLSWQDMAEAVNNAAEHNPRD